MWAPLDEHNSSIYLLTLGTQIGMKAEGLVGSFTPKKLVSCILVTFKEPCNSKIHHFSVINLLTVHATALPPLDDDCHSTTAVIIKKISLEQIIQNACPVP